MPYRESTVWCPTCGAAPRRKCVFTGGLVKGRPMSTLHDARVKAEKGMCDDTD